MIYIGIDPGISGAVGLLDSDGIFFDVFDLPIMKRGKTKNKINAAALAELLKDRVRESPIVMVEQVWAMPGQGASSGCSLGHSVGVCEAVSFALGFRTHLITPQAWKKHFKLAGGAQNKELARAKAIEYFPSAPLSRKKDSDRAEALLMARYLYETKAA